MSDRTVHGINAARDAEVVRYDRAGKWYLESISKPKRRQITVGEAVGIPRRGEAFLGRPGGGRFDALYRSTEAAAARASSGSAS